MSDYVKCPKCNRAMTPRNGKFGPFWGCTGFPYCKGIRKFVKAPVEEYKREVVVGTAEQDTIWDALLNDDCHVIVNALAGTGKSFTCREALWRLPADSQLRVVYLAFSKAIVEEFRPKCPPWCEVSTLNAIGHKICCRAYKSTFAKDKIIGIVDALWQPSSKAEVDFRNDLTFAIKGMVDLARGYLVEPSDVETLRELVIRHDIDIDAEFEDLFWKLVPQVIAQDKASTHVIDYADQLWLPVANNLPCPQYDLILIDEAQDLNACQHALVLKLLAPGGRVAVVGDVNQAIFGWRGSDTESIANLTAELAKRGTVKEFPLTISQRCPIVAVEDAQEEVPEYKAKPGAERGEIIETTIKDFVDKLASGDMVICRVNAPLCHIAYTCIKRGQRAVIRGRDIGQGLRALIRKLKPSDLNGLLVSLDHWQAEETAKYAGSRFAEQHAQNVEDKADCIRALAEEARDLIELNANIDKVFADFDESGKPRDAVVLSSIHRAKGLEAHRVVWAYPEIECRANQEWQARQERNLRYVAKTRTKHTTVKAYGK